MQKHAKQKHGKKTTSILHFILFPAMPRYHAARYLIDVLLLGMFTMCAISEQKL